MPGPLVLLVGAERRDERDELQEPEGEAAREDERHGDAHRLLPDEREGRRPRRPAFTAVLANAPVRIAPSVAATPWTANTSRESSRPSFGRSRTAREGGERRERAEHERRDRLHEAGGRGDGDHARRPRRRRGRRRTSCRAGRARRAPRRAPRRPGRGRCSRTPVAARPFAASARAAVEPEPAEPEQARAEDRERARCAGAPSGSAARAACRGRSRATSAAAAALMWTTVPPAKSRTPRLRSQPPGAQTQCATGA